MNQFFQSPENVEVLRKALNTALLEGGYVVEDIDPCVPLAENGIDSLETIDLLMQIEDLLWDQYRINFPVKLDSLADFDGNLGDYPQFLFDKLKELDGD